MSINAMIDLGVAAHMTIVALPALLSCVALPCSSRGLLTASGL
jgi:hypothetical protein